MRDETLGEDRCRVRKGNAAQVLAAIRNACVHLLGEVERPQQGGRAPGTWPPTRRKPCSPPY